MMSAPVKDIARTLIEPLCLLGEDEARAIEAVAAALKDERARALELLEVLETIQGSADIAAIQQMVAATVERLGEALRAEQAVAPADIAQVNMRDPRTWPHHRAGRDLCDLPSQKALLFADVQMDWQPAPDQV